jgi:hypothetical protein
MNFILFILTLLPILASNHFVVLRICLFITLIDILYYRVTVLISYLWLMHVGCFYISVYKCEQHNIYCSALYCYWLYNIICFVIIYWMNVDACLMFLYFVLSMNRAIYISRHCIVIDCIHIFAFYCSLDQCLLHGCLICVMIVSRAHYVSDLFQHRIDHLFYVWHILYPWSENLFLTCDWICLNTINTVQYNNDTSRTL